MAISEQIHRHKTAIRRGDLSRPLRLVIERKLVGEDTTVFDYGCGHGGDVERLKRAGVDTVGWDPSHRPDEKKRASDVVNIGYVVNVIENSQERMDVLRDAWSLARSAMVVSAQLTADDRNRRTRPHGDGYITGTGTFQKYYEQQELRQWIDDTLGEPSVALAPGVFVVFRDRPAREEFVAAQFRRRIAAPRIPVAERLFEEHREILEPLIEFLAERGRPPCAGELAAEEDVVTAFGSLRRAQTVLNRVLGDDQWAEVRRQRADDLLVYLALSRFEGRLKLKDLPPTVQADVKAFFSNLKSAKHRANEILVSLGHQPELERALRSSPVGKFMPRALYVHRSAIEALPVLVRIFEGCARHYLGDVDDTQIVKLNRVEPKISYLGYPTFDKEAHPALTHSVSVSLQTFRVRERFFHDTASPPILHRKEQFVLENYPKRDTFARLTKQEERRGLFDDHSGIGTREGWEAALESHQVQIRGHRLVAKKV